MPLRLRTVAKILSALAAASACAVALAGGTHLVSDHANRCTIAVPTAWTPSSPLIKGSVGAPDKSGGAIVSSMTDLSTTAEVKPVAQRMLPPTKTFEDSASRLWYAYEGNAGTGTHWYVAVPHKGGGVCLAQVSFKAASDEAMAKAIALSLGTAN